MLLLTISKLGVTNGRCYLTRRNRRCVLFKDPSRVDLPAAHPIRLLYGEQLPVKNSYRYLGVTFSSDNKWDIEFAEVLKSVQHSSCMIANVMRPGRFPPFPVVVAFVRSFVLSRIAYSFPVALFSSDQLAQLDRWITFPIRRFLNLHLHVSPSSLFVDSQIFDSLALFYRSCLSFLHRLEAEPTSLALQDYKKFVEEQHCTTSPVLSHSLRYRPVLSYISPHSRSCADCWIYYIAQARSSAAIVSDADYNKKSVSIDIERSCLYRHLPIAGSLLSAPSCSMFLAADASRSALPPLIASLSTDSPLVIVIKAAIRFHQSLTGDVQNHRHIVGASPFCKHCLPASLQHDSLLHRLFDCPFFSRQRDIAKSSIPYVFALPIPSRKKIVFDCIIDSSSARWGQDPAILRRVLNSWLLSLHFVEPLFATY